MAAAATVGEDRRRRDGRRSAKAMVRLGGGEGLTKGHLFIHFKDKDFLSLGPSLNLTGQIKRTSLVYLFI